MSNRDKKYEPGSVYPADRYMDKVVRKTLKKLNDEPETKPVPHMTDAELLEERIKQKLKNAYPLIPCVGGCGREFSSTEIMNGFVTKVGSGSSENEGKPICGKCLQKQTHGKNGISEFQGE